MYKCDSRSSGAWIVVAVLAMGCASATGGGATSAETGSTDAPPAHQGSASPVAEALLAEERATALATPVNRQRVTTLTAYPIGGLSESQFWADQWNARDPLYGNLGVVGAVKEYGGTPTTRYVLGVIKPRDLSISKAQASFAHDAFVDTVATDRQALLETLRAGVDLEPDRLPHPLSARVTNTGARIEWPPTDNDLPLFDIVFIDDVLASVTPAE